MDDQNAVDKDATKKHYSEQEAFYTFQLHERNISTETWLLATFQELTASF